MNGVQLIGRLTHDPEADQVADGTTVASFRLAVDRPRRDSADFVTVKVWDRTAEAVLQHLVRGRRVAVQGRLFHDEWTGADGQRVARLIVVGRRVEFLDPPTPTGDRGVDQVPGPPARPVRSGRSAQRDRASHPQPVEIPRHGSTLSAYGRCTQRVAMMRRSLLRFGSPPLAARPAMALVACGHHSPVLPARCSEWLGGEP